MPRRPIAPLTAVALALGIAGSTGPSRANSDGAAVRLDYELYAGGLQAIDLSARLDLEPEGYEFRVQARTDNWIGWLFPFVLESRASGSRHGETPTPERYRTANRWRDNDVRWVALRYSGRDGNISPHVAAEPASAEDDRPVVPTQARAGTVDPLTALLRLLLRGDPACGGEVAVFDGRRRYDLAGQPMGTRTIEASSYTVFDGEAQGCRLTFKPVTGFWNRFDEEKRYPRTVDVWTARVADGLPPVPVRMEADTGFAAIRMHLTGIRRGAAAVLPPSGLEVLEEATLMPQDLPENGR